MAYHENIDLFQESQRNRADVFNEPLQKLIANIEDTRSLIGNVQTNVDDLEENLKNNYTATEQLNDLLATGIKGDKGDTGEGLEYNWDGTALGVKMESEQDFVYRELKGEPGDVSTEQLEQAIQEAKTELENEITNIPKVTKTSELTNDSGFITANDIPTTLPASDVYDWAKQPTKPSYTASEVGALASNGTAASASKVANALTLQIAGTTKNTFDGSTAQFFNIPNASTSTSGVMTTDMVTKLNGVATGATKNTVDTAMSSTSTNAVQNKVIYAYIQEQIKNAVKGAGDYMGKTMINVPETPIGSASGYTYTNSKGGFADLMIYTKYDTYQAEFSLIVDGTTIITNGELGKVLKQIDYNDNTYELKIPFKSTFTVKLGTSSNNTIQGFIYVNE